LKIIQQIYQLSRLINLVFFILLIALPFTSQSQNKPPKQESLRKRMKSLEAKKEEQDKEEYDVSIYLKEKHQENQSKGVQKRMKASRKKAERLNRNRKKPMSGKKAYKFKTKLKRWIGR
jgi:hypothetical protein